jgi:hypothetical protein
MRTLALFTLLATLAPWCPAQRAAVSAPAHIAPARPPIQRSTQPNRSFALRQNSRTFSRFRESSPFTSPYISLPFPFFGDSFSPDDIYSTGYPVASQPPAFVLQAASALAGSADSMSRNWGPDMGPDNTRQSHQPLVIELQNGRYVRIRSTAVDGEVQELTPSPAIAAQSPPHDLPSAVLIFRDGHSEEVRDYAIADGILYARGDYYIDGYWNKRIALSTLDLAQTLQANTNRNVNFVLPSSPNEVITRP